MASKFIDLTGIGHVWSKIKTQLNGKADIDLGNVTNDNFRDKAIDAGVGGLQTVTATSTDGVTYTATVSGVTALTAGLTIVIIPDTASTSVSAKLNVNGLGAKYIRQSTTNDTTTGLTPKNANWMAANKPITIQYDGTQWKTVAARSNASDMNGVLAIANGGTGATTVEQARENLGIKDGNVPVGFEYISFNPNIPVGSLPLFGETYSREAYADLWAWVQTQTGYLITEAEWQAKATANGGNVPFYSDGDGSTTFRVPSLSCWVRGANGVEEVGSYLEAGLPNIEGSWIPIGVSNHSENNPATGAFTNKAGNTVTSWGSSSSKKTYGFDFDASLSNPIYGASDTVQPPSIVGMYLVKAFGTVSNVGNQDIVDISAGLTRVEEQMTKYTDEVAYIDAFIVETWSSDDGLSWYRKYSDGWIEQGGDIQSSTKNESVTVTLPTAFTTTTYCVIGTLAGTGSTSNDAGSFVIVTPKKTTGFTAKSTDDTTNYLSTWYACGY